MSWTAPSPTHGQNGESGHLDISVLIANDATPIPGELAISVASLAELQFGVLVAKTAEARALRLARLSAIQRRFDPLPIVDVVADSPHDWLPASSRPAVSRAPE
ncbi:hypothetical protein AB0C22_28340 [Micromonospora sp. NPDC048894]|uniref:hypothetical protein n=1 Tax=Micromonospora sp. NPDC048894 TaxID=3155493 RepID=UPI0033F7472D